MFNFLSTRHFQELYALKALDTIGNIPKIIDCIKTYLVTRAVEKYKTLWETAPCEVNSFWERSNFHKIWFRDFRIRFWGPEIKHLKAHNISSVTRVTFFNYSRNLDDQLSPNSYRFAILCMLGYTKWGNWSLTITKGFHCRYKRVCIRSVTAMIFFWNLTLCKESLICWNGLMLPKSTYTKLNVTFPCVLIMCKWEECLGVFWTPCF